MAGKNGVDIAMVLELVAATSADVRALRAGMLDIVGEIRLIQVDIREMKSDIREMKAEIREIQDEIGDMKVEIRELRAEMRRDFADVRREITEIRRDVSTLQHDVGGLREEVRLFTGSVQGHGLLLTEHDERIGRLERGARAV